MKTAIVTGAASGIGLATAVALLDDDFRVYAIDLNDDGLNQARAALDNPAFIPTPGDVSDTTLWSALATEVRERVDVLVHNAFALSVKPLHEQTSEEWGRQFTVILGSVLLSFQHLHTILTESAASVVLVSSVHSRVGIPGHPAYAAAKGGLNALARQLAVEYGPEIRVNTVVPGPIKTPVWDTVSEDDLAHTARATALGRLGSPAEVAHVIAFLASAKASYIDGAELVVDGGWSITKESR